MKKIDGKAALSLAGDINSSMNLVGGLYGNFSTSSCTFGFWNGVDVIAGKYMPIPCAAIQWNLISGYDIAIANSSEIPGSSGFTLKTTLWNGSMGNGYLNYADLGLYYSLNELHYGNYSQALSAFETANKFWNGKGFVDAAYNSTLGYASYKLALDLIAFKDLRANSHTIRDVSNFTNRMTLIESYMSKLQIPSSGGVVTNYNVTGGIAVPSSEAKENGETTSLFVLAS